MFTYTALIWKLNAGLTCNRNKVIQTFLIHKQQSNKVCYQEMSQLSAQFCTVLFALANHDNVCRFSVLEITECLQIARSEIHRNYVSK